jgi:hypothetical protein
LGSTVHTAVSEIRPQTSEKVTVATILIENKTVIDLRNPRKSISPFAYIIDDSGSIGQLLSDLPLLESLSQELSRPVSHRSLNSEFTPSQYLCEMIKSFGYDGVLFRSSVGDGHNLVLFNYKDIQEPESLIEYSITKVEITFDEIRQDLPPIAEEALYYI